MAGPDGLLLVVGTLRTVTLSGRFAGLYHTLADLTVWFWGSS